MYHKPTVGADLSQPTADLSARPACQTSHPTVGADLSQPTADLSARIGINLSPQADRKGSALHLGVLLGGCVV